MADELSTHKIAFIILTWNSAKYISNCIESILRLPITEMLVLVFDNGSIDDTLSILESYESSDCRLIVHQSSINVGTTRSRNQLIRAVPSDYEYICVLDSDTVINYDAITKLVKVLRDNPNVGVVGPRMCNSRGIEQLSGRNLPTLPIKLGKACPIVAIRDIASNAERTESPVGVHLLCTRGCRLVSKSK